MATAYPLTRRALLLESGLVFPGAPGGVGDPETVRALDRDLAALGFATTARLRGRLGAITAPALWALHAWLAETLGEHVGANRKHAPLRPAVLFRDAPPPADAPVLATGGDLAPGLGQPAGAGPLRVLDLGEDLDAIAAAQIGRWCARTQPMSAQESTWLDEILGERGHAALPWLPAGFPVRETMARALAALERGGGPLPDAVLAAHLRSAPDVLRFLAAGSGADPALQGEAGWGADHAGTWRFRTRRRFPVAKLPRARRRALFALLEAQPEEQLCEDFLRHRSYWVWLGEFLHPHEYAARFPRVARAFALVRRKAPDGTPAAPFRGRGSRLEAALRAGAAPLYLPILAERPGELARRLDHALRQAGGGAEAVLATFAAAAPQVATPVLLTLWAALPTRVAPAAGRIYWPKGPAARAILDEDQRAPLPAAIAHQAAAIAEAELLRRFAAAPAWGEAIVDDALADVPVPFNARTASPGAIALPRGARIPVPPGDVLRLFLHWCEPAHATRDTDLDLSVAFYDAAWRFVGVCSYYELSFPDEGPAAAVSAGDRTSAPFPDGATEFVDLTPARARAEGVRYAMVVVNAYSGLAFGQLERAWAGLARVDEHGSEAFDPRLVAMRFGLAGEHGAFLPLAFDLEAGTLHWLDIYVRGAFELNTAASSEKAITLLGPALLAYFASGVRPTMRDLALLQAAARAERVWLRGDTTRLVARAGDAPAAYLARLRAGLGDPAPRPEQPAFAALHTGDLPLPAGCDAFVLFPGRAAGTLAAADLLP